MFASPFMLVASIEQDRVACLTALAVASITAAPFLGSRWPRCVRRHRLRGTFIRGRGASDRDDDAGGSDGIRLLQPPNSRVIAVEWGYVRHMID